MKTITYLSDTGCLEIQGASLELTKKMSKASIRHVIVHELLKESNKDFDHSKPYNLRDTELDKTNDIV
ncbi:hypothetical protein SNB13_15230, partial [Escherichia coli]|nr:hypothetical protein [Escherichia coli]